jgi:WD40 repeat protein
MLKRIHQPLYVALALLAACGTVAPVKDAPAVPGSSPDLSTLAGGPGGNVFNDVLVAGERFTKIDVCANAVIVSIQFTTNTRVFAKHGGAGGTCVTFTLGADETITELFGRTGLLVDQIGFRTDKGRTLGPYGGAGGVAFSEKPPVGSSLAGFNGGAGLLLDRISLTTRAGTTPPPAPVSSVVTAYQHGNFAGLAQTFAPGGWEASRNQLGTVGNDSISSVRVPANTILKACRDDGMAYFAGGCRIFTPGDHASVGADNDTYSYLEIQRAVSVYRDADFLGPVQYLPVGAYEGLKGGLATVGDRAISSVRVPDGLELRLCNASPVTSPAAACQTYAPGNTRLVTSDDAATYAAVVRRETRAATDVGRWSDPLDWPLIGVHSTLMPDGKVVTFASASDDHAIHIYTPAASKIDTWTPSTNAHVTITLTTPGKDLFCAGQVVLPNGTLLMTGGSGPGNGAINDAFTFRTGDAQPTRIPNMAYSRWYGSLVPAANAETLVIGGDNGAKPEIYQANGTWRTLSNVRDFPRTTYYYWMHLAPNGKMFYSGRDDRMAYLDTTGQGTWTDLGNRDGQDRWYGSSVMYDLGKVLVMGGRSSSARTIDLNPTNPIVTVTGTMARPRTNLSATLLADGTVLASGGNESGENGDQNTVVYTSEIWNPTTGVWKPAATNSVPREYHSSSVLLPDGRVLTSGGGFCGECPYGIRTAEMYSPPYLFKGPRPQITAVPATITTGSSFQITTPQAANIRKVALIRLGSMTHSINFSQRYVPLAFTLGAGALSAALPTNRNLIPTGHYLLVILDAAGVPSVAPIVKIN